MTWDEVKQSWSDGWSWLETKASDAYEAAIKANPLAYSDDVEKFVTELTGARANLDAIKAKLPASPSTPEEQALVEQYQALEKRYNELAAGFYSDAQEADGVNPSTAVTADSSGTGVSGNVFGIVPILIVAGLAVGAAGATWGVAAYEYAANLREQTELASKELDARIEATKEGRVLQASTLPTLPSGASGLLDAVNPTRAVKGLGKVLLGALVIAGGALLVPQLLHRK